MIETQSERTIRRLRSAQNPLLVTGRPAPMLAWALLVGWGATSSLSGQWNVASCLLSSLLVSPAQGQERSVLKGKAEVNGGRLYYEVTGEGPALVLIHGGGVDNRMWDDQFQAFASHHRVIRYDVLGAGRSDIPRAPYSYEDDLYRLLKLLNVQKAALLGLSRGGRIAVSLALKHPDLAEALILTSSNLGQLPDAYRHRFSATLSAANNEGILRAVEVFLDDPFLVPVRERAAARERMRQILLDNLPMFLFLRDSRLDLRPDPPVSRRLSEIRVPTLIISGDRDHPTAQANARSWESGILGSRRVVIPGAAHLVNMDQPEQFNRVVLEFLRSPAQPRN